MNSSSDEVAQAGRVAISQKNITLPKLGVKTRVLEAGTGSIALLLHGNPDNAEQWIPVMNLLAATHRCIAPDIPGYGKSPEPPMSFDYSASAQAAFVDELLSVLGINEPVLLIVHDIGGVMGVAWAAGHIGRLGGLLITNTVAFEGFEWFAIAKTWGRESWLARLRAKAGMRALAIGGGSLFKKIYRRQSPQLSEEQLDRVVQSFALNPVAKAATLRQFRKMMKPGFFEGFDDALRRITKAVPTLVLWGDRDPYVPVRYAQNFADARVVILPEAGHWVALVEPQRLADEARRLIG
jgi:pimeloyl-ACP methyl ester carboxylesterase